MKNQEFGEGSAYIGYKQALSLILPNTSPVKTESLPLSSCTGYVSAEDVIALVNSPADDISLKDGFAVKAKDTANAASRRPVRLQISGSVFAGGRSECRISNGQAVKVCTGAPVPAGADAVVPSEFCQEAGTAVLVKTAVKPGNDIFFTGEDIKSGTIVIKQETVLLPARLGLAAAAGISHLKVTPRPKAAFIAVGDELIAPGQELKEGQLYASNVVNGGSWLSCFGIPFTTSLAADDMDLIKNALIKVFPENDVIVTSGGAWGSERDLTVRVLDSLGWKMLFRQVRMLPGKGTAFGIWKGKPVFCLPGGPSSNETAFLQLALPGILNMAGIKGSPLPTVNAELTQDIKNRRREWTEFKKAKLARDADGRYMVTLYDETSRLKSMAESNCLICKPEGVEFLHCGQKLTVQVMLPAFGGWE